MPGRRGMTADLWEEFLLVVPGNAAGFCRKGTPAYATVPRSAEIHPTVPSRQVGHGEVRGGPAVSTYADSTFHVFGRVGETLVEISQPPKRCTFVLFVPEYDVVI